MQTQYMINTWLIENNSMKDIMVLKVHQSVLSINNSLESFDRFNQQLLVYFMILINQ